VTAKPVDGSELGVTGKIERSPIGDAGARRGHEVIPGMRRDPRYLERKGYQIVDGRVVQPAGPNNPLGRVKLMLPNPHHVYLHDTPQRSYFDDTSRTFSHGCVRVQNPFEVAALASDDPAWTNPALLSAAANGKTRTIVLRKPLPVLILYWTAAAKRVPQPLRR
jgi:murein L,D-transpeptidase YcbB/YkuD